MNTTFYGVLGVGPDADDDAIRAAYRERVKDHHPDVSTAPDAAERFKRLTAAKEALLDPTERQRYDRLGHASYVDAHGDPSLWELDCSAATTESSPGGDEPSSGTDGSSGTDSATCAESASGQTAAGARSASTASQAGTAESKSSTAGSQSDTAKSRSGAADRSASATGSPGRSRWSRTRTESGSQRTAATGAQRSRSDGSTRSSARGDSGTRSRRASSTASNTAGWSADATTTGATDTTTSTADSGDDAGWSARRSRARRKGTTESERSARAGSASTATDGSHARGSFWDVADGDVSDAGRADPLLARAVGLLRTLGGWILVHLLFLALAAGTGWYVYAVVVPPAHRSLALLFVVLGEVALAVSLSSLHVLSRVYR